MATIEHSNNSNWCMSQDTHSIKHSSITLAKRDISNSFQLYSILLVFVFCVFLIVQEIVLAVPKKGIVLNKKEKEKILS